METGLGGLQVVFSAWVAGFGETVFSKFVTLLLGAVLTTGRRTVRQVLRVVGELADADPSSDHRVWSMRRWSMWSLARPWVTCLLDTLIPDGVLFLAGDETVTEHPGRKVFGQGRHRDAQRSSHSFVAHLWGHGHRRCGWSGGAGDPREAAGRSTSVGVAGVGRTRPQRAGQHGGRSATPDSQRPDAATAASLAALVSRTTVRDCRRRRRCEPQADAVRAALGKASDAGEPFLR